MEKAIIALIFLTTNRVNCMNLPDDVEILDGAMMDVMDEISPEYYPQDTNYYEVRSLSNFGSAIRNKRDLTKEERELNLKNMSKNTIKHNDEETSTDLNIFTETEIRKKRSDHKEFEVEHLPSPEKQTMDMDSYKKGRWNIQTLKTKNFLSESTNNEDVGYDHKGRSPRVNFITQQKPPLNSFNKQFAPEIMSSVSKYSRLESSPVFDMYPSRSYDPYLRRYDRFDELIPFYEDQYLYRKRYDPYDSYSPRQQSYSDQYYNLPEEKYIPESRDYRFLHSNSLYEGPTPPVIQPRRRVVYYAHLPEIVRHPMPRFDTDFKHHRYDDNWMGPISGAYTDSTIDNSLHEKKRYRNVQPEPLDKNSKTKPRNSLKINQ